MTQRERDLMTRQYVVRAIAEYDRLGLEGSFSAHGFGPTMTYDLVWGGHYYPPKAILGTAYEFATGQRLGPGDFEGGQSGALTVLENRDSPFSTSPDQQVRNSR